MNTGISPKQDDASNSNLLNIGQDHSLQYQGLEHNDSQYRDASHQAPHQYLNQFQAQPK